MLLVIGLVIGLTVSMLVAREEAFGEEEYLAHNNPVPSPPSQMPPEEPYVSRLRWG